MGDVAEGRDWPLEFMQPMLTTVTESGLCRWSPQYYHHFREDWRSLCLDGGGMIVIQEATAQVENNV